MGCGRLWVESVHPQEDTPILWSSVSYYLTSSSQINKYKTLSHLPAIITQSLKTGLQQTGVQTNQQTTLKTPRLQRMAGDVCENSSEGPHFFCIETKL